MSLPAARLQDVLRLRCSIFGTSYNPTNARTGAKILRSRLRGPAMVNYYPERVNIAKLNKRYPGLGLRDLDDEQRLLDNEMRRRRGKAPPKKGEGRRATMKKK